MSRIIREYYPLIIALAALLVTTSALLVISVKQNHGKFIYAFDDAYIHMAIAKNVAQHKVWGITKYEFSSSSSSPLWVLILSLVYSIVGVNEATPFILNIIFAIIAICVVYFLLKKYRISSFYTSIVLLALVFFTPLPSLIFTGLEHILQVLLSFLFVYFASRVIVQEKPKSLELFLFLILGPLLTFTRYEGLFVVVIVGALLILRKKFLYSLLIIGVAILPIVVYGILSTLNGWFFLPNSILLKGNIPNFSLQGIGKFFYQGAAQLMGSFPLLVLLGLSLFLFIFIFDKEKTLWKDSLIVLAVFIISAFCHLLFAKVGSLYRYEAYLVGGGIVAIAIALKDYLSQKIEFHFNKSFIPKYVAIFLFVFVIILPLVGRSMKSLTETLVATNNIYEHPYQVALFVKQFYKNQAVAVHDIGAINFFADIKCLDLWGLGTLEVALAKKKGNYDTKKIYNLAEQKGVKVAFVYDDWTKINCAAIPEQWVKVGEWTIPTNTAVIGGNSLSIYGVNLKETENLINNLRAFSPFLPKEIIQSGMYMNTRKK